MIDLDKCLDGYVASRPAGRPSWRGSLPPGSVVGGWRLVAFVGRGRSAEVYRAESVRMGGEIALKLLVDGRGTLAERFRQEMEVLQSLPMKSLPRFFGSGDVGGRPYYAMEYLQPLILPLPRHEAAPFAAELALAVAELHDADSFREIGKWIRGARRYFLQKFTDRDTVPFGGFHAPTDDQMREYAGIVREFVPFVGLRGIED